MKFTKNKFTFIAVSMLAIIALTIAGTIEKKNQQVHLVQDMPGFQAELAQVIRRNPTVRTVTRLGENTLQPPSQVIHSWNSNTSNSPNIGFLGKTADIVGPHIVMHTKTPISAVEQAPAHIGDREEYKTITSYNQHTGKVESHEIKTTTPILGTVTNLQTVYKNSQRSYDLTDKRFGPIRTEITPN